MRPNFTAPAEDCTPQQQLCPLKLSSVVMTCQHFQQSRQRHFGSLNQISVVLGFCFCFFTQSRHTDTAPEHFPHPSSSPSTFTCMVKTPSSWEDSFFIWSARTCASSRMENSVSAPQYPQESAAHIRTKLRAKKAEKPPRTRPCVSPRAARVFGVKGGGLSPGRLAMMAVGLQAGGTRSLSWWRKGKEKMKKLQGETTFTTLQLGVRVPLLSGASLH